MGNAPGNGGVQLNASGDYAFIGKVSGNYLEWRQDTGRITINGAVINNPTLALPAFSVSIGGGTVSYGVPAFENAYGVYMGSRSVSVSGGVGAITYVWDIADVSDPNGASIWITPTSGTGTNVYGTCLSGGSLNAVITVTATDSNGRVARASIDAIIQSF
jgi:hypothetical protein